MKKLQTTTGIIKSTRGSDNSTNSTKLINYLYIRTAIIIFLVAAFLSACAGSGGSGSSGAGSSAAVTNLPSPGEGNDNRSGGLDMLNTIPLQANLSFASGLLKYETVSKVEIVVHSINSTAGLLRIDFPLAAESLQNASYLSLDLGNITEGEYIMEAIIFHFDGRPMLRQARSFVLANTALPNNALPNNPFPTTATTNSGNQTASIVTLSFAIEDALFKLLLDSPFNLEDTDGDGKLEIFHPSQLAALANEQLNLSQQLQASYELTANLNLSAYSNWRPIGDRESVFSGSFDGNGFSIYGLRSYNYIYAGLFGYVQNAVINNTIVGVEIIQSTHNAGGLSGRILDSQISNIELILGDIEISGELPFSTAEVGGLVGDSRRSYFSNILIRGSGAISAESLRSGSGALRVGGFVGEIDTGEITNVTLQGDFTISANSPLGSYDNVVGGFSGFSANALFDNINLHINGNIASTAQYNNTRVRTYTGLIFAVFSRGSATNINATISSPSGYVMTVINPGGYDAAIVSADTSTLTLSDMEVYVEGDVLIESGDYGQGSFAFVLSGGSVASVNNTNILMDGDITLATSYPSVSPFAAATSRDGTGVDNTNIIINGDIMMGKQEASTPPEYEYISMGFAGLCRYSCPAKINNTSLVINGDLAIYATNKSVYWSAMFDEIEEQNLEQISDNSVLINGSVLMQLQESDLYFAAIGINNYNPDDDYYEDDEISVNKSSAYITGDTNINATFAAAPATDRINLAPLHQLGGLVDSINIYNSNITFATPLQVYINDELSTSHSDANFAID